MCMSDSVKEIKKEGKKGEGGEELRNYYIFSKNQVLGTFLTDT